MKRPRFFYPAPGVTNRKALHVLICADCGAPRRSTAKPGSLHAPKICKACQEAKQDRVMLNFVRRKGPLAQRPSGKVG